MTRERKGKKKDLFCPYCEAELVAANLPTCQACGVKIFYCPSCRQPLPRDKRVCPNCGAKIKG